MPSDKGSVKRILICNDWCLKHIVCPAQIAQESANASDQFSLQGNVSFTENLQEFHSQDPFKDFSANSTI